jgi:hypothetical protein
VEEGRMVERPRSTLWKDFAIFGDAGFLVTLALLLVLMALATGILLWASEKYSIPLSGYWS